MTSPSPLFKLNGGAAGVKLSVSAAGLVTATLDDTSGVTYVEWAIIGTDETTAPGNYTLSVTSGSVPGSQTTTFNAGAAGTAGILRARINHGVNSITGNAASEGEHDVTIATAKWYVPAAVSGLEVFVDGEVNESDAVHGQTGELNQAIRLAGGVGPSAFTYIELGSGTKAGLGLVRMSRNFVAMACRTAAAVNHTILAEDNTDGFQLGDSTLTARWVFDVKTGGTWGLRVNGVTMVQMASTGISLGTGAKYGVAGVDHTTDATPSSLAFRGANAELAVGYLYSGSSLPTTGLLRHRSGFTYIASTTAAGGFDNEGFVDDGADGWKIGNDTRSAAVRFAVKTGGSITWEVNNVVEGTMDATGLNLASGNTFQINALDVVSVSAAITSIGRDASGSVALRAGNGETASMVVDGTAQLTADGDGVTVNQGIGFFNTAPVGVKPTITGSRAGNAALASLLTSLASLGLITDSTTA